MPDIELLRSHLVGLGRILLGYSGGVDSAFLAVVCRQAVGADRFLAVIGRSASYPAEQYRTALGIAHDFSIPLLELETHELNDERYRANPVNRCYFCKHELWTTLSRVANQRGFDAIIDGTNADDLTEHRPGLVAASEIRVRSPLAELGWTKPMVRNAARALGISIWDAPAQPCLSSRIRYGVEVTPERLAQVETAEAYLRTLGVRRDLRIRHLGTSARVEVSPDEMELVQRHWSDIEAHILSLGFAGVHLDPRGYRRGAMLDVLAASA